MATVLEKIYTLASDAWASVRGVAIGQLDGSGNWVPFALDPSLSVPVVQPKSTTITTSQTSVTTTAVQLFNLNAAAAKRALRCITADIFIGSTSGVLSTTGFLVKAAAEPPAGLLDASVGEVWAITASGTAVVYTFEQ